MDLKQFETATKEQQNEFLLSLKNSDKNISDYKVDDKIRIMRNLVLEAMTKEERLKYPNLYTP